MESGEALARQMEERRVRVDEQRLEIERGKDRREARQGWFTRIGVVVPLAVALIAAGASIYDSRRAERNDFELKAAEIAFQDDGPYGTLNRSRALRALFPERLPTGFASAFNPAKYEGSDGTVSAKKELLTLMAEHPQRARQILESWKQIFPQDDWTSGLEVLTE